MQLGFVPQHDVDRAPDRVDGDRGALEVVQEVGWHVSDGADLIRILDISALRFVDWCRR